MTSESTGEEVYGLYGTGHFGSLPEWVSYATPAVVLIVLIVYLVWLRRR